MSNQQKSNTTTGGKKQQKKQVHPQNGIDNPGSSTGSSKEDNLVNNTQRSQRSSIPHSKASVTGSDEDGQSD